MDSGVSLDRVLESNMLKRGDLGSADVFIFSKLAKKGKLNKKVRKLCHNDILTENVMYAVHWMIELMYLIYSGGFCLFCELNELSIAPFPLRAPFCIRSGRDS